MACVERQEIPTLGQVRGKIVLIKSSTLELGIPVHITELHADMDTKETQMRENIKVASQKCEQEMMLSFTGATGESEEPLKIAPTLNKQVDDYLLDLKGDTNRPHCVGIIAMDFPGPKLIQTIINFNGKLVEWEGDNSDSNEDVVLPDTSAQDKSQSAGGGETTSQDKSHLLEVEVEKLHHKTNLNLLEVEKLHHMKNLNLLEVEKLHHTRISICWRWRNFITQESQSAGGGETSSHEESQSAGGGETSSHEESQSAGGGETSSHEESQSAGGGETSSHEESQSAGGGETSSHEESQSAGGGETSSHEESQSAGGGETSSHEESQSAGGGETSSHEESQSAGGGETSSHEESQSAGGGETSSHEESQSAGGGETSSHEESQSAGGGETTSHEESQSAGGGETSSHEESQSAGGGETPKQESHSLRGTSYSTHRASQKNYQKGKLPQSSCKTPSISFTLNIISGMIISGVSLYNKQLPLKYLIDHFFILISLNYNLCISSTHSCQSNKIYIHTIQNSLFACS